MSTYVFTDLHGRKDLFLAIKEFLQDDDIAYCLGDSGDRGPDGWELIKMIYEDDQIIYLKGNHEDMLVNAMIIDEKKPNVQSRAFCLLRDNGGEKTFYDWINDGRDYDWIKKLSELPCHAEYTNQDGILVLLSHAGYTPWWDEENPTCVTLPDEFQLIWNRDHFYEDWDHEHFDHHVIIHGHTPIPRLADRILDKSRPEPGAYWYEGGKKCCLDNLSAFSDIACLMNLDTFESVIIKV